MKTLKQHKGLIVGDIFVRTADENYVTARWCFANKLFCDFYWLAAHSLEKYLKAVLLLNDNEAKSQSHDIGKLYLEVVNVAGTLLPDSFTKLTQIDVPGWSNSSPEDFVKKFKRFGNPDNRYANYGYSIKGDEVFKLDQLVFAIRRIVCDLSDQANSAQLLHDPNYRPDFGLPLDELVKLSVASEKRHAVLNFNFAFAPPDYLHTTFWLPVSPLPTIRNPVVDWVLLGSIRSTDSNNAQVGINAAKWLLANIKIPQDIRVIIESAVADTKTKHALP